jgi:ATP-dependent protease HslVU (ClpYQ) ATPase subunit
VDNPATALKSLLAEHENEERAVACQLVHEYAERFRENHGLTIRFTAEAADALAAIALRESQQVRDVCAARFKDYQFGLKLISQNTGQQEFTIDETAVESPDKVLSDWVVASYRKSGEKPAE